MPPRWGWGFAGDVACYKHVAPLALDGRPRLGEYRKLQRSAMFIETSANKSGKLRRSGMNDERNDPRAYRDRYAAPLGLGICWGCSLL